MIAAGRPLAGAVGNALSLDQHHVAFGVLLLRLQCGPQSAKPTADDKQVAIGIPRQRGLVIDRVEAVQPVSRETSTLECLQGLLVGFGHRSELLLRRVDTITFKAGDRDVSGQQDRLACILAAC